MELEGFLELLVSGGAGAVIYWLMDHTKLKDLSPQNKRYVSLGLAVVIPVVAWLAMVGLGYSDMPTTWQGWLENAFALMSPAILVSQGMHGALELGKK